MTGPDVLLVADGASIHTRRLARALADRDLSVELATFEPAAVAGVAEHRLGTRPVRDDRRYPLAVPRLAAILRERRPRVIHAHYISSYGVLAAAARLVSRLARPHLVQSAWGTDLLVTARRSRLRRALASFALRGADLVTGDSDDLLAAAAHLAPATPRCRFVFGPPRALTLRTRAPEPIMVSTRRLDAPLRVGLVVRAFRRAREIAPEALASWRLVVAGDGSSANEVRRIAAGDPAVEFVGTLEQDALHALLLRARVLVSVPASDATSAALLEGMSAGAVPVVNDLPANREWVDERVGIVVSRDPEVEELARALVAAAARRADVDAIRERVRSVVWEEQVDALVAAYGTL